MFISSGFCVTPPGKGVSCCYGGADKIKQKKKIKIKIKNKNNNQTKPLSSKKTPLPKTPETPPPLPLPSSQNPKSFSLIGPKIGCGRGGREEGKKKERRGWGWCELILLGQMLF